MGHTKFKRIRENSWNFLQIGSAAGGCLTTIAWGYNLIIQDEKKKRKLVLEIKDDIQEGNKRWEIILQSVERIERNQMMDNFMRKIRDGSKNRPGLYLPHNYRKEVGDIVVARPELPVDDRPKTIASKGADM